MADSRGVGARCGRLLLFAALLLGIVTMHTLGHPSGGHGGMDSSPGVAAAGHGAAAPGHGAVTDASVYGPPAPEHASFAALDPRAPLPAIGAGADGSGHEGLGMDPMAMCLAVLLGVATVALVAGALLRPGARPAPAAPRGPPLLRYRPATPPHRPLLSRLSVLRI